MDRSRYTSPHDARPTATLAWLLPGGFVTAFRVLIVWIASTFLVVMGAVVWIWLILGVAAGADIRQSFGSLVLPVVLIGGLGSILIFRSDVLLRIQGFRWNYKVFIRDYFILVNLLVLAYSVVRLSPTLALAVPLLVMPALLVTSTGVRKLMGRRARTAWLVLVLLVTVSGGGDFVLRHRKASDRQQLVSSSIIRKDVNLHAYS